MRQKDMTNMSRITPNLTRQLQFQSVPHLRSRTSTPNRLTQPDYDMQRCGNQEWKNNKTAVTKSCQHERQSCAIRLTSGRGDTYDSSVVFRRHKDGPAGIKEPFHCTMITCGLQAQGASDVGMRKYSKEKALTTRVG